MVSDGPVLIRSLAGQLLVPVLAILLVSTTPLGTGQGAHHDALLHPVLPHTHLIGGRMVTEEQLAADRASATGDTIAHVPTGPAIGGGGGADAAGLGLAIGPSLPSMTAVLTTLATRRASYASDDVSPREFREAPQDPPPDAFA